MMKVVEQETPTIYRKRRTTNIRELIININSRNKLSTCTAEVRNGWNAILEDILHANNVYAGYGYYQASELPEGFIPGAVYNPDGRNDFPDSSRIFFYVHDYLKNGNQ